MKSVIVSVVDQRIAHIRHHLTFLFIKSKPILTKENSPNALREIHLNVTRVRSEFLETRND